MKAFGDRAKRDYAVILLSSFMANFVGGLLSVTSLYIMGLGNDNFLVGLSAALPFFVAIPMSFFWGSLSDFIGKRKPIIIYSSMAATLIYFILPFLDVYGFIFARTAQLFFTSSGILVTALVTEYFPREKGKSIGDLSLWGSVGSMAGGFAVGFVIASQFLVYGDPKLVTFFYMCGALSLVSALVLFYIVEPKKTPSKAKLRNILKLGDIKGISRVCYASMLLHMGTFTLYAVFYVFLQKDVIPSASDSAMIIGIFSAASSIGGILGAGISGRACDRFGRRKIFILSLFTYFVFWILYSSTTNMYALALIWAVPLYSFYFVSASAMISDITSENERGRGMGILNSFICLGAGVGSLIGGYASRFYPYQTVFRFGIVFILSALLVSLFSKETLKKMKINGLIQNGIAKVRRARG